MYRAVSIAVAALLAASCLALERPLGDLDGDLDLRPSDLAELIAAVRNYRCGCEPWNRNADVDNDGQLAISDIRTILDRLTRALSADPWQQLIAAEQDLLAGRAAQARGVLEWLVQVRGSWPRTHGLLAVAYHILSTDTNGLLDQALAKYRDFAHAWRTDALGEVNDVEAECEAQMMLLLNDERRRQGLMLLLPNPDVAAAAYYHSLYMNQRDDLSHFEDDPLTESPVDRVRRQLGCTPERVAENVGMLEVLSGIQPARDAADLFDGFMRSEMHRSNILNDAVRDFAVAFSNTFTQLWCTQNFIYLSSSGGVCPGHEPE